ncbi:hypothetical protein [Frigoribacterium sp. RIT-PI-h]|uniref:hypothetical protein n=1 Tax=Frigoribacterium sp. RIT-PI-h TaxID=1690245 RepID=UPI00128FAB66|nr:hypothetical protein [Frigoribacterium sp. RIT-PI-h]
MTAPTPDIREISSRAARVTSADWGIVPLQEIVQLAADDVPALIASLAAVTAERDDARREVEHQKWIKAQNTAALVEQLDQARQMLADAPHDANACATWWGPQSAVCTCWKAGL